MTKEELAAIRARLDEVFNTAMHFGWTSPHTEPVVEQLIKFDIPALLNALNEMEVENNRLKAAYQKCLDCPIVCGKESWLKIMDENLKFETERDQWKARAEALEKAIKTTIPCKFCRLGVPETALCYASGWEDCKGTYFDFDEVRFAGGEKTNE